MTNEEALEYMKKLSVILDLSDEYEQAMKIAVESIQKQTPKKPEAYYDGYYGVYPDIEFKCPCCSMGIEYMDHHCECGQTIDWGEEE